MANAWDEVIESIETIDGAKLPDDEYEKYTGYKIETSRQVILLLIADGHQCCEEWGYFFTNDDTKEFIGAVLNDITVTDPDLSTISGLPEADEYMNVMFVTLETDRGRLQFVAYNAHNGYYGHRAILISDTLISGKTL